PRIRVRHRRGRPFRRALAGHGRGPRPEGRDPAGAREVAAARGARPRALVRGRRPPGSALPRQPVAPRRALRHRARHARGPARRACGAALVPGQRARRVEAAPVPGRALRPRGARQPGGRAVSAFIPLVDAPALAPHARRTFAVRTALLLAAVAAALLFVAVSRDSGTRTVVPLAAGADTVVVVDLSASINYDAYTRIGATLDSLARGGGRLGLVLFSDDAYEALPPGTPARDLLPFVRYFRPIREAAPGPQPVLP